MGKKIVFLLLFMFSVWMANAQNTVITGVVTDSVTGERLPYISLRFKGTATGAVTNDNGYFSLSAPDTVKILEISCIGYNSKEIEIIKGKTNSLKIQLVSNVVVLNEMIVKPKREKYSKKENPAVELVKKVIDLRKNNDPHNHDYFQYNRYEKIVLALNNYEPKPQRNGKPKKFDFLANFVDTLDVGTIILPLSEKEKVETVYYRKKPKSEKRVVKGSKSSGVDEVFSRDGVQQVLNEVFKEVDIFQDDIPLFLQRFVSPLSSIGPNYYKYYLLDTLNVNGQKCVDLGFVPFNSETFGFTGHLYVTLDSTYFIQKIILNVPKNINLNFVSRMTVEQQFKRMPDSTRIIMKDDISVNFKLTEKSKGMYARRLNIYSNQSFEEPDTDQAQVFKEGGSVITLKGAYNQPDTFWISKRPEEAVRNNPNSVDEMMVRLRSVPLFYITEKIVSTFVSGYIPTDNEPSKNKFEFGPVNTTISGSTIEGTRLRVGGATTPSLSKNWFFDTYVAYGTKDEKFKYNAVVEYSFNDRKEYPKEFPMNSIRFEQVYDINKLGQQYMYTNKDNMFLSIRRQNDTRATYQRKSELTYTHEYDNGLSHIIQIRNHRESATEYAIFDRINADGTLSSRDHYDMTELELKFRYGKDEKFYQTRNFRIPITYDALIFNFSHVMAKKGLLGSFYDYHRTDIGIQKRIWFSAFGYVDIITKAGKVWSKVPYPLLILPNANLSYTIQPEAYTNMNAMEFINDEYISWDLTYYMNGNLLNRLPFVKKLKWREVFCSRGLWGHLTDKNNPANGGNGLYLFPSNSYTMGKKPYMEMSVGIENIFKFIRVDYVWRLNYLNHPDIQTKGIRCTIQLSF